MKMIPFLFAHRQLKRRLRYSFCLSRLRFNHGCSH